MVLGHCLLTSLIRNLTLNTCLGLVVILSKLQLRSSFISIVDVFLAIDWSCGIEHSIVSWLTSIEYFGIGTEGLLSLSTAASPSSFVLQARLAAIYNLLLRFNYLPCFVRYEA